MGPIPAYAGQPKSDATVMRELGAYPRVCGATATRVIESTDFRGLSPRMRGNRCWPSISDGPVGPIPAYAGQPMGMLIGTAFNRAYPRVCGATMRLSTSPLVS